MLHQTVLSRVIGDHSKCSPRSETIAKRRQRPIKPLKLLIDGDAKPLKDARKVAGPTARAQGAPDRADKIITRFEWPCCSAAYDLSRQAHGAWFVGVFAEYAAKLRLPLFVEQSRGSCTA